MLFLGLCLLLWIGYVILYYKLAKEKFLLSKAMLPLLFMNFLISIDFAVQMFLITSKQAEFIFVSKWVLGDNSLRPELYPSVFRILLVSAVALVVVYMILTLIEQKFSFYQKFHKK